MNEETKKEFARLFDWYEYTQAYGYSSREKTLKIPTEAEVYAEIGRLLEIKRLYQSKERVCPNPDYSKFVQPKWVEGLLDK